MVEIDPTQIIITLFIGVGVPLALFSMKGFRSTSEGTLTGTIKIEGLSRSVVEVKEEMQKNFDRLESQLNKREDEMRTSFADVNRRIEEISRKVTLNEYRISSLERTRIRDNTNGGSRGSRNDSEDYSVKSGSVEEEDG